MKIKIKIKIKITLKNNINGYKNYKNYNNILHLHIFFDCHGFSYNTNSYYSDANCRT